MLVDPKESVLRRLEDPDEELKAALERLRKNHYSVYLAVREYQQRPERLEAWRAAQKPSQAWRQGRYFDTAVRLLYTNLYG